jgi:hypothetical protein
MTDFVFEIIMDEWPEWDGNQLYDDKSFASFCATQDYEESFYSRWRAGYDDAEEPGNFTWEFISKNLYHLYEDGNPTGIALKIRHVNSLGE